MKSKLNDSSSKGLGAFNTGKRGAPNETGNFGKNHTEERAAEKVNILPTGTSSTLPDIKNFYQV